jgi:hypothetical protein
MRRTAQSISRIGNIPPGYARTTIGGSIEMDAGSEAGMTKIRAIPA